MHYKNLLLFCVATLIMPVLALSTPAHHEEPDPARITYLDQSSGYYNPQNQEALRAAPAWKTFLQKNDNWWVHFDEFTGWPKRAFGTPVRIDVQGDWVAKARHFFASELAGYDIPVDQLALVKVIENEEYVVVKFRQEVEGIPVAWSRASVRFNQDGAVYMFALDIYRDKDMMQGAQLTASQLKAAAAQQMPYHISGVNIDEVRWLALPQEGHYQLRKVQEVVLHTTDQVRGEGRYYTLVDVTSGKVHYRSNLNHNCTVPPASADATLTADIVDNPLQPSVNRAIPDLMVITGTDTFYTDANGEILLPNLTQPTAARIYLAGRHARVVSDATGQTPYIIDTLYPANNPIDLTGKFKASELAGYFHTDVIHDHMKQFTDAGFVQMDTAFRVNVDITSGNCNAFYNGVSINFYAPGGGCPATVLFSDVVYHEYGHGINYEYYDYWGGVANNGALQEGYADVWAFSVTEDPVVGQGFQGGSNTFVRRYDVNPKVYPQDLVGQVHADGEIIAGAFWDTYLNLGKDMDKMLQLFTAAQVNTPIAPDGAEGLLYSDILLEVLLADDNDGNLVNGTPNDSAIIHGFARHGISLLANVTIDHNPLLAVDTSTSVQLDATVFTALPVYLGDVVLHYRTSRQSAFTTQQMTASGTKYSANLGTLPLGTIVEYYFEVEDAFQIPVIADPLEANLADPNLRYYLMVGYEEISVEDFDVNFGLWSIDPDGTDLASTGVWEINEPQATYDNASEMVQTNRDHTPNNPTNICAFTGNASGGAMGDNDVDDGHTTLQSPVFDLTTFTDPVFSYWRWFINDPAGGANPGNDAWKVFISNDGQRWVRVERTFTSDRSWRQNVIRVKDYVTPTATVSLRFVAEDSLILSANLQGGSIMEAAIDDLALMDVKSITTGVETLDNTIELWPNPASNYVTISMPEDVVVRQLRVMDITGKVWQEWTPPGQNVQQISTATWPAGMYWVQLSINDQWVRKPLVIQ